MDLLVDERYSGKNTKRHQKWEILKLFTLDHLSADSQNLVFTLTQFIVHKKWITLLNHNHTCTKDSRDVIRSRNNQCSPSLS